MSLNLSVLTDFFSLENEKKLVKNSIFFSFVGQNMVKYYYDYRAKNQSINGPFKSVCL